MAREPSYTLMADLNGDGTFETDWSAFIKGIQGLAVWRSSALDAFSPRSVTLLMDNQDKRFSPKNTGGPYSPDLKRGRKVQLKATVTTPAVTNLIDNPSLETNGSGWAAWGRASSAEARYGDFYATQVGAAGALEFLLTPVAGGKFAVSASTAYVFRGHLRVLAGVANMRLRIKWYTAADAPISIDNGVSSIVGNPWVWLNMAVTSPATAAKAELYVAEDGDSLTAGETLLADGADFYAGSDVTLPYCDGDQPQATWTGTAHGSTSSRPANPMPFLFTGLIRSFALTRLPGPIMGIECGGILETLQGLKLSAGPFTRKPAHWIIDRLLDLMTTGQVIDDGAFRISNLTAGVELFAIQTGGMSSGVTDSAKSGGADPETYGALEGDLVRYFQTNDFGDGKRFTLDLTSRTNVTDKYDLAVWVGTNDDDLDGLTVQIKIEDDVGVIHTESIVLDKTTLVPVRVLDKQYNGGSTARYIRFYMPATITALLNDWFITGLSFTPSKHRIDRTFPSGTSQFDSDLEYLDGFERSAIATLEEAVRSAGGWWYEDGNGSLVFEDFDNRSATAVPKLRLTDDAEIGDGFFYSATAYSEPAANFYNRIRVASFGDVSLLTETARDVWAFEPLPRVYGANRRVLLYASYFTEEEVEGLIARRLAVVHTLDAGNFDDDTRPLSGIVVAAAQQPYVENYGRQGIVIFQTDTAIGLTLGKLKLVARAQNRSTSERTFVDKTVSGTEDDQPRILELETPAQGYKTQLMTDMADWAARYGSGLSTIQLEIEATTLEYILEYIGRQPGLPVRFRHVSGPGAFMVDELYHVEGWKLDDTPGELPRLSLLLEEAA